MTKPAVEVLLTAARIVAKIARDEYTTWSKLSHERCACGSPWLYDGDAMCHNCALRVIDEFRESA